MLFCWASWLLLLLSPRVGFIDLLSDCLKVICFSYFGSSSALKVPPQFIHLLFVRGCGA